jgi:hypothetical protein
MLERLMSNGARTIRVESPDRFARDLMVQFAGHDIDEVVKMRARRSWESPSWSLRRILD